MTSCLFIEFRGYNDFSPQSCNCKKKKKKKATIKSYIVEPGTELGVPFLKRSHNGQTGHPVGPSMTVKCPECMMDVSDVKTNTFHFLFKISL